MKDIRRPFNPFVLTGYVSLEYFCDREKEAQKMASALQNGRNITLISPRRMGKTGLIRHLFHQVEASGIAKCYYVDLYQTDSLAMLVKKLGETVLGTLDTAEEKLIKRISVFFKSLRPTLAFDSLTGEPNFSVEVQPESAEHSLAEIFAYMEQSEQRCYVAFDEFQTVASYADKQVEALLRAHIQHLTNVNFIYSGSQRHVLENMFVAASRPFYQSTQMLTLGPIDSTAYYAFASAHLQGHGQSIPQEVFEWLFTDLSAHTWYVQSLLNRLYETAHPILSQPFVNETLEEIIEENEVTFQTFLRLISPLQARVLKAIAQEGTVKEIQGKSFLSRYGLGAASSVKTAVKALVEKELLLESEGVYEIYDRFFARYLRQKTSGI